MRRITLLIALALPQIASGQASEKAPLPAFEFKGHVLGQPLTGESDCGYSGPDVCEHFGVGVNGAAVNIFYNSVAGSFEGFALTFHSDMFAAVRDAFVAKYGPPASAKQEPFETRSGAKATNVVMTWPFAQGTLTLHRFGYSLVEGEANIETARYQAADAERRKQKAAQAARKDM